MEITVLRYKNAIIVGDMHINIKNEDQNTNNYIDTIYSNGFVFINSMNEMQSTRKSNSVCTYIDHCITDKLNFKYVMSYNDLGISDYRVLTLNIQVKLNEDKIKQKKKFVKVFDHNKFMSSRASVYQWNSLNFTAV